MSFPFLPGGAILAAAVLIGALTAFGLVLRAIDRAIVGVRDTAVSGLVAGWRTWGSGRTGSKPAEPQGAASPWTLSGTDPRLGRPTAPTAPPELDWPAPIAPPEIVDLGSRRIDPPGRPRR